MRDAAYLGEVCNTAHVLRRFPRFRKEMDHPELWYASDDPGLREAAEAFTRLTGGRAFEEGPSAFPDHPRTDIWEKGRKTLMGEDGSADIRKLLKLAGRKPMQFFSTLAAADLFLLVTDSPMPTEQTRTRLRECAVRPSGAAMRAPYYAQEMRLTDAELMTYVQRRLGVPIQAQGWDPIPLVSPYHRCVEGCLEYGPAALPLMPGVNAFSRRYCTAPLHQAAAHALGCKFTGARFQRHNEGNSAFGEILAAGGASVTCGEVGVSCIDGQRGDGIASHAAIGQGGAFVFDTTVKPSLRREIMRNTASVQDFVLLEGEKDKHTKYDETCKEAGFEGFFAVVINGQGGLGPEARKIIKDVWQQEKHTSRGLSRREREAKTRKRRRLSCASSRCAWRAPSTGVLRHTTGSHSAKTNNRRRLRRGRRLSYRSSCSPGAEPPRR